MAISIRDQATREAMKSLTRQDEVYDESGEPLGYFVPRIMPKAQNLELGLTEGELDRIENDPNETWCTAEEVMARLRSLRKNA